MELPKLCMKDQGIRYSEWVIGEYTENLTCPYKVVRLYSDTAGKQKWELSEAFGDNEDLFDVKEPDTWYPLNVRGIENV